MLIVVITRGQMSMNNELLLKREVMDTFPKVELHRHIEGSFHLETLYTIARRNNLDIPESFVDFIDLVQFPKNHKPDFALFLSKFRTDWYRNYKDIEDIIYHSVLNFKKENLFFLELRFSPEHFCLHNDFNRIEVTKLILSAANNAAKEIGLKIKYLITLNRNKQNQHEMLALYRKIIDAGFNEIIGFDLAGNEEWNPAEEFIDLFSQIHRENKIGITIHAGEVTPPEQIWKAVDKLHAKRIGHGTAAIKDLSLQEKLKKEKIYLEQCPVSNYFTGSWIDTPSHPFKNLYKDGVLVTLNSDDPTIQDTNLTDDYIAAIKYFDINVEDLKKLNIRSLEASFMSDREKRVYISEYEKRYATFKKEVGQI